MSSFCKACQHKVSYVRGLCLNCYKIAAKFKFNPVDIYEQYAKQDFKCLICGSKGGKRLLSVDHNHKTGAFRGLLCTKCNIGLGYFTSTTELKAAVDYLSRPFPKIRPYKTKDPLPQTPPGLLEKILNDDSLSSLRIKARALSDILKISEDAAMSRLRRCVQKAVLK